LSGGTARREGLAETLDTDQHVHDLIIAALFTMPGERVNRPRFGAGLNRTIFENMSPLARSAIEYRIRESLSRDLGDQLVLEDVLVEFDTAGGAITVLIDYLRRVDRSPNRLEIVI
jgi:phage baseplate assembly protein W